MSARMRLPRIRDKTLPRVSAIRNAGWMVRYYGRSGKGSPDTIRERYRQRSIKKMVLAIQAAIEAQDDPERILLAIYDALSPRDDRTPF